MTGDASQIHPIHVHLQCFLASLFIIHPRLRFRCVFDLAVHAPVPLASCMCFSSSVLPIVSFAFWTDIHSSILAHFLATLCTFDLPVSLELHAIISHKFSSTFDRLRFTLILTPHTIAHMIDLSAVRAESDDVSIQALTDTAVKYQVFLVTVLPSQICFVRKLLGEKRIIKIGGNIGFPSGGQTLRVKLEETKELLELGCDELDMVINIAALLSGRFDDVRHEISAIVDTAQGRPVKVILECHYLSNDQIRKGCDLAIEAGAQWVKTSTGWTPTGATKENISLIKKHTGNRIGINASGGIKNLDSLLELYRLGARRFGISRLSGEKILDQIQQIGSIELDRENG